MRLLERWREHIVCCFKQLRCDRYESMTYDLDLVHESRARKISRLIGMNVIGVHVREREMLPIRDEGLTKLPDVWRTDCG